MDGINTPFKGILRITGGPIVGVALKRRYRELHDFVITPIPGTNNLKKNSPSELKFLFFAEGGGYATQLIDVNTMGSIGTPTTLSKTYYATKSLTP
jgi:hypothetical protein